MALGNRIVARVLRSRLHPVLSRSVMLIRYRGRRRGKVVETPVQYAAHDGGIVVLVGRPEDKSWWRSFRQAHDLEVLVQGTWRTMTGRALAGTDAPDEVAPLLEAYGRRFPKALGSLPGSTPAERAEQAVVVWCRPR